MNENTRTILRLSDGQRTAQEIAEHLGLSARYVRKVVLRHDAPRLPRGARPGQANHQYGVGRRIDRSGYAVVSAPPDHPYARPRPDRPGGKLIYEHRLVMEQVLGRHLLPSETVDHIDGLTLHNSPDNLRVFASNAEHLRATLSGAPHRMSPQGRDSRRARHRPDAAPTRVDMHRQRKAAGDVRLRQILLALLRLGPASPFLSGTSRYTTQAGIDPHQRPTIERALAELETRWAEGRLWSR